MIIVSSNSSMAREAGPTSTENSIAAKASSEQIVNNGLGGHSKGTTAVCSIKLNQKIVLIKQGHSKGTTAVCSIKLNQKIVLIKEEAAEQ